MPENDRYSGQGLPRQSYMSEFVVECPKCKHEAMVTVASGFAIRNGQLRCNHCMHVEVQGDLIRYKAVVKRHCDTCRKPFDISIPNQRGKVDEITIPCPHCGTTRTYKPKHDQYQLRYEGNGPAVDPIFGLPLWFQADIRGDLFWAYNRQHLQEIKLYVMAKLRERPDTTFSTMVERLPTFIKHAKNRELLIKMIERLERKSLENSW